MTFADLPTRHTGVLERHTNVPERHTYILERNTDILERHTDADLYLIKSLLNWIKWRKGFLLTGIYLLCLEFLSLDKIWESQSQSIKLQLC